MRRSIIAGLIAASLGSLAVWADGINIPFSFPATTCTNQFIRSIAASTGVGSCATVGSSDLASSLTLTTPNIGAATGTSINFGGTTLNTYTAGTWTPVLSTDGTAGTPAYSVQLGSYEQIGRFVRASFSITITGWTGSPTGNVVITGLPVTSGATANDFGGCKIFSYTVTGLAALNYGMGALIAVGSPSNINVVQNGSAATTQVTAAQFGTTNGNFVRGFCVYHS